MMGIRLQNEITTGMKSPKREKKPNNSSITPITGHPMSTRDMPRKKNREPRAFFFWKKNRIEREGPIISVTPVRNNTFPIANKPFSKNINTPRPVNATPNAVSPIPIFRKSPNAVDIAIHPLVPVQARPSGKEEALCGTRGVEWLLQSTWALQNI